MADHWDETAGLNGDEGDDEALRIAIARSLGRDPEEELEARRANRGGGRRRGGVIDLTRDDEEEDDDDGSGDGDGEDDDQAALDSLDLHLRTRLIPPEMWASPERQRQLQQERRERYERQQRQQAGSASSFFLLGLDRKKMEEERLARLGKRKVDDVDGNAQESGRPAQRMKTAWAELSSALDKKKSAAPKAAASAPASASSPRLPFPRGVVKKTWAYGQPRQGDDIKIEEVLQKQHLQLAVLSSYQWDEDWLMTKVDMARTKLILVAFAGSEAQKEEMVSNAPRERIRFCFPPMHGIGAMHSKLMLLKYEGYMRIVVPTGNLMSFDWGETGTMENMVFIIDLPKFASAEEREAQELGSFAEELIYFLTKQGLDEKLVDSLRNYDFTETHRYRFVHTISGTHMDEDAWRTGYCGLGKSVGSLVPVLTEDHPPIELDFVCASLGAVNYGLLTALYYACQGNSVEEYDGRTSGNIGQREAFVDKAISLVKKHMRIFFPSRETVLQSKGGKDGAGTICFQAKWWQAATFPRQLLRDCKSVRPGMLMHSKIMFVRPHDPDERAGRCFAYVGSANLSESAWGRLSRDRSSGNPKLTCRNWECGVLVHVENDSDKKADSKKKGDSEAQEEDTEDEEAGNVTSTPQQEQQQKGRDDPDGGLDAFAGRVPVPMEWPGRGIFAGGPPAADRRGPWFYQQG